MGIKIRVRVAGEDGTQKLEVPEVCTLGQLRKAVATKCMGDSCAPSAVAITLNRTDDVGAHGAVNESATLRACGIARGDLIHVFQWPGGVPPAGSTATAATATPRSAPPPWAQEHNPEPYYSARDSGGGGGGGGVATSTTATVTAAPLTAEQRRRLCLLAAEQRTTIDPNNTNNNTSAPVAAAAAAEVKMNEPPQLMTTTTTTAAAAAADSRRQMMDVDAAAEEDASLHDADIPESLARVLAIEDRATSSSSSAATETATAVELLLMAVHALLLEAGLTLTSSLGCTAAAAAAAATLGSAARSYALPSGWRAAAATNGCYKLRYTLAEGSEGVTCTVRAQAVGQGHLVLVGSLDPPPKQNKTCDSKGDGVTGSGDDSGDDSIHRFTIATADHVVLFKGGGVDAQTSSASLSSTMRFTCLRQLWSRGKDALAMRLKAALCRAGGLPSPPALLTLPDDLKLSCLARLSAVDLAAVSCASAELRYLAAADDLWRPLYVAEFGGGGGGGSAPSTSSGAGAGTERVDGGVNGYGSVCGFKRMYGKMILERRAAREARRLWEEERRRQAQRFQPPFQPAPSPHPHPLGGFFGG